MATTQPKSSTLTDDRIPKRLWFFVDKSQIPATSFVDELKLLTSK